MADKQQDKHEKALDLTEAALEALDTRGRGKGRQADRQAKKLDPDGAEGVVEDLEEAERAGDGLDEDELEDHDLDEEEYDEEDEEAAG